MALSLVLSAAAGLLTAVVAALWASLVAAGMADGLPDGAGHGGRGTRAGGRRRQPAPGSRAPWIPGRRDPVGGRSVAVVPCVDDSGCFRWAILCDDGTCAERSAYAYATVAGARAVGEIRLREQHRDH